MELLISENTKVEPAGAAKVGCKKTKNDWLAYTTKNNFFGTIFLPVWSDCDYGCG